MTRCLMTHSLLSSWLYTMKGNPYEDATTERDPLEEFMQTLRRESTEPNEAMMNGIAFEDMVTAILHGAIDESDKWYDAASRVAEIVQGGRLQYKASEVITVNGRELLLYGRLDALKGGTVYDIKFSKSYERGKYIDSTQHPVYLKIVPDAQRFVYLVSNGAEVWQEEYRRDETPDICPIISDFLDWLDAQGLMKVYEEKWLAR